eukprot:12242220-Alexandrium_andersonii.AAC.1
MRQGLPRARHGRARREARGAPAWALSCWAARAQGEESTVAFCDHCARARAILTLMPNRYRRIVFSANRFRRAPLTKPSMAPTKSPSM